MWEMFEDNFEYECDECGGPGPPPEFIIPPPPRPQFMQELIKCTEEDLNFGVLTANKKLNRNSDNKSTNIWDSDICEAIPILDASYHSSPTLQTSAIIAVFSLLLILVILISSLFVWKHKRKVQNFLPCKTPTRGPHMNGSIAGGNHSVTYEDPDAHLGHRPLMVRTQHNVEVVNHSKSIHYPSGYPMTRSPPFLVCSSPGPDPYRSNDNVYEELDQTGNVCEHQESESERGQSDDDFAEDELSLPGERTFNKSSPPATTADGASSSLLSNPAVSTIYHECQTSCAQERNSLLSSSSGSTDNKRTNGATAKNNRSGNFFSGVFRNTTGRSKSRNNLVSTPKPTRRNYPNNTLPYNLERQAQDLVPANSSYADVINRNNSLMQLSYSNNCHNSNIFNPSSFHNNNNNNINNNNNNKNNNNSHCRLQQQQLCGSLEADVERRNRINSQLHRPMPPPVATIYRNGDRINYGPSQYPQPYYHTSLLTHRSRTNPRSLDRRRLIIPPLPQPQITDLDANYGYAEPVFHEGLVYNPLADNRNMLRQVYPSYVLPDFTTGHRMLSNNHYPIPNEISQQQSLYSRDSSLGSDSGFSQHTSLSGGRCNRSSIANTTPNLSLQLDSLNSINNSNNPSGHTCNKRANRNNFSPKQKGRKDNNFQSSSQLNTISAVINHGKSDLPASGSGVKNSLSLESSSDFCPMDQSNASNCSINSNNLVSHKNSNNNLLNSCHFTNDNSPNCNSNCSNNSLTSMNNNSNLISPSNNFNGCKSKT